MARELSVIINDGQYVKPKSSTYDGYHFWTYSAKTFRLLSYSGDVMEWACTPQMADGLTREEFVLRISKPIVRDRIMSELSHGNFKAIYLLGDEDDAVIRAMCDLADLIKAHFTSIGRPYITIKKLDQLNVVQTVGLKNWFGQAEPLNDRHREIQQTRSMLQKIQKHCQHGLDNIFSNNLNAKKSSSVTNRSFFGIVVKEDEAALAKDKKLVIGKLENDVEFIGFAPRDFQSCATTATIVSRDQELQSGRVLPPSFGTLACLAEKLLGLDFPTFYALIVSLFNKRWCTYPWMMMEDDDNSISAARRPNGQ